MRIPKNSAVRLPTPPWNWRGKGSFEELDPKTKVSKSVCPDLALVGVLLRIIVAGVNAELNDGAIPRYRFIKLTDHAPDLRVLQPTPVRTLPPNRN